MTSGQQDVVLQAPPDHLKDLRDEEIGSFRENFRQAQPVTNSVTVKSGLS